MQEKLKFHVEQTTSGEIIYREDHTMLGAMPETLIFKTRKELAEYINPQVTTPAAAPYPSNQSQASAQFNMSNLNPKRGAPPERVNEYFLNEWAEFRKLVPSWLSADVEKKEREQLAAYGREIGVPMEFVRQHGMLYSFYKAWKHYEAAKKTAEDSHSKSKAWINEIDKAYGDHPKMNINAANAANTAGLASKQLNMQNSAFNANDYYPHNLPKRCNDGTVFKSKEDSKPPVKPEIAAMAEFAVKCGYGGRFREFSLALAGIGCLADECLKEQVKQDDSDIEQIARERKGGATVKVSLNDLQDDGK